MKLRSLTLVLLGGFCTAMTIHAAHARPKQSGTRGGSDGGGGGAFVCRGRPTGNQLRGKILNAELADLWEARNLPMVWEKKNKPYVLNVPYSNESVEIQIQRALAKLKLIDPAFAANVKADLDYIEKNHADLRDDVEIEIPGDAKNVYRKKDCPLEGMMYFDGDTEKLNLRQDIFRKLINRTNTAAAKMHEALYKTLRDMGMVSGDSTKVRKINGCLFSTDDCFGIADTSIYQANGRREYLCRSNKSSLKFFETTRLTPDNLSDRMMAIEGEVVLPKLASTEYAIPLIAKVKQHLQINRGQVYHLGSMELHINNSLTRLYLTFIMGEASVADMQTYGSAMEVAWSGSGWVVKKIELPQVSVKASGEVTEIESFDCTPVNPKAGGN